MPHWQIVSPVPDALGDRARNVIGRLRSGALGPAQADEVGDLIGDLTDGVMRHFFVRPAEAFKLGMASRGAIDLGVRSCVKTIRIALKQILPRLPAENFKKIADYIEDALQAAEAAGEKA